MNPHDLFKNLPPDLQAVLAQAIGSSSPEIRASYQVAYTVLCDKTSKLYIWTKPEAERYKFLRNGLRAIMKLETEKGFEPIPVIKGSVGFLLLDILLSSHFDMEKAQAALLKEMQEIGVEPRVSP